ncbi:MAG: zinc ribbon domain-containing protein [Mameliella sp.]|nr:zinc ribbon domain-containing protein [Phaeodactylibacter sp.]NRA51616.1 zinc ribbon domain-containing protein [Phaeodactylibacter sp.]
MKCVNCHTELPDNARFCFQCGAPQPQNAQNSEANEGALIDLEGNVSKQLSETFFGTLRAKIEEEQPGTSWENYQELLYESGFRDLLHRRDAQLADELRYLHEQEAAVFEQNNKVNVHMEELTDYFLIHYAGSLNTIPLPQTILKHQGPGADDQPLESVIFDYLDFGNEPNETVYTDFVKMPVQKLRNAGKFFLKPERRDERIYFICDQSLLGSCKEGFAMTERGLYWKAQLQVPHHALYESLREVRREKDWLIIDGSFFNINPGFNIKMLKLLKRLQRRFKAGKR